MAKDNPVWVLAPLAVGITLFKIGQKTAFHPKESKKEKYNLTDKEWKKFKLHKEYDPTLSDKKILDIIQVTRDARKQVEKRNKSLKGGECFSYVFKDALDRKIKGLNDSVYVHAVVNDPYNIEGKKYSHAWVERGGKVYDWQTMELGMSKFAGVGWDKEVFYDLYNPEDIQEYTAKEIIKKSHEVGHVGPWEKENPGKDKLKKEILQKLPEWFPDWLYRELNPEELKEYISLIYHAGLGEHDIKKIPEKLYHVTPNPQDIMKSGFKTAKELGVKGFGGHGTYVSLTTFEEAEKYLENMVIACKILNREISLNELKNWMKKTCGSDEAYNESLRGIKLRYKESPEYLWRVFQKAYFFCQDNMVLFFSKPTLEGKDCDKIKIVESRPSPNLKYRHHYNIFPDVNMNPYYTYNKHEKEWRVYNPENIKPTILL